MPEDEGLSVETVRLENLDLRVRTIEQQLERVLTMVCPVCGPAMVKAIHPDAEPDHWHAGAGWSVVKANGAHGE